MKSLKNILFLILSMLVFSTSVAQTCLFNDLVDDLVQQNSSFQAFVESEKGFRAWKILATEAPSLRTDMQELTLVLNNLELIENVGTKNYKSWKLLKDAGRTQLMKNADVLETLTRIRNHPQLSSFGLTDKMLVGLKGSGLGEKISYKVLLEEIETFMTLFDPKDIEQFSHLVRDLQKGGTWTEGAEWTLCYLNQNTINFKGRKLVFEQIEKWGDIENKIIRITDVTDKTMDNFKIFYEFKSVKEVPPNGFVKQFINDLSRREVQSLEQIKWIFDGKKIVFLPQDKFIKVLEDSKDILFNNSKAKILLEKEFGRKFIDSDDLIESLINDKKWFNKVFQKVD